MVMNVGVSGFGCRQYVLIIGEVIVSGWFVGFLLLVVGVVGVVVVGVVGVVGVVIGVVVSGVGVVIVMIFF